MHQQLELFGLKHILWLYHKVVTSKVTFVTWEVHHSSVLGLCPPEVCNQFDIQTSCHRDNDGTLYNPMQLQAFLFQCWHIWFHRLLRLFMHKLLAWFYLRNLPARELLLAQHGMHQPVRLLA